MKQAIQTNRTWHAKFQSGEQIIADYFADKDLIEIWYRSETDTDWRLAEKTTAYGRPGDLSVVRKWAPTFDGTNYTTLLVYNPALNEMTIQMSTNGSKVFNEFIKAEDKDFLSE